jgi:ABC-type transport system involved in multi-copper enzyme maturation permease subunit
MQPNRLFEIGLIILVVGAVVSLIGGIGESGYIQCIASSGSACTATASTQYITVFLANSETLSVGLSIALIGAVIMIGGSITNSVAKLSDEMKAAMSQTRLCPKCGAQVALTSKFCQSCGNKFGE